MVVMSIIPTRFECNGTSFPLVLSVFAHLSHSFRAYLHIFPTRFECSLVTSAVIERALLFLRSNLTTKFATAATTDFSSSMMSYNVLFSDHCGFFLIVPRSRASFERGGVRVDVNALG